MNDSDSDSDSNSNSNADNGGTAGLTVAEQVQAMATAQIEGELAALAAAREAAASRPRRRRRQFGQSIVYSLRLDVGQIAALERRAALLGVPPTALARNLIRAGLTDTSRPTLDGATDQLATVVVGLRALAAGAGSTGH